VAAESSSDWYDTVDHGPLGSGDRCFRSLGRRFEVTTGTVARAVFKPTQRLPKG
jgi:hypothetical protein